MKKIFILGMLSLSLLLTGLSRVRASKENTLLMNNIEVLASPEGSGNTVDCYSESKVVVGRTYYDCGSCEKVRDEKGLGSKRTCIVK